MIIFVFFIFFSILAVSMAMAAILKNQPLEAQLFLEVLLLFSN
jgi:NADH:ubiquinone oxidoreductase subunit 6 (subunit J)